MLGVRRREPAIDFRDAHEAGLRGLTDEHVLELAARDKRVLVSHDQKTMPQHFARFVASNTSPGLLIIPQRMPISLAIEGILLIWTATTADEWLNQVSFIPR
ncbi:MAG TPA: DUF5615 family PIN-like protein [Blastocatellia bacterium]|nr:DUF5615 family PIN-like protein [Blastocatellia bacterium]